MKLTIKTENGQRVVDLKNDLQFKALKGEEYVFSNGFSNYVLNFKDNQESVVLTFNVNGKSIKVELNGIVPLLQANTSDMSNPTAIIINKDINNKDVDNIIDNTSFNGGEIINQLESLMSNPIDLGNSKATNLTLITDYQTLLESLGAAAAGGDAGGNTSNGSTFNSTFSLTAGALNGIADSARGENLTESISTTPVDSGNTIAIANTTPVTATIIIGDAGSVKEADGAILTYSVKLSNAVGSDVEVDLTTGGTASKGDDYTNTLQYSTNGGTTWLDVPATGKVTLPADGSSVLVKVTVKDDAITENDETVTLTATTTDAQITTQTATGTGIITDDRGNDNPDVDEDVKANIEVTDAGSVKEADGAILTYSVKLSNAVGSDVEVDLTTGGTASKGDDYTNTLQYSTNGGTTWLDVPATGKVTLPADGSSVLVKVTVKDDAITENDETVTLTATTTDAQITTQTATGTGIITDDDIAPVTVTVSEEGLANGIPDNNGTPTDSTNETSVEGTINISNLNLSSNKEFMLNIPSITLSSHGEEIVWELNADKNELIGKTSGEDAIKVTIDETGKYSVELLKPIDHPVNSVEDVVSFDINVTVKDGTFQTDTKFTINIEDDMPTVEDTTIVWTQSTTIPDIFTGNVSFTGNGGTHSSYSFAGGSVLVTGKGFTSSTDLDLVDASLSQSSGGLGVASSSSPYHNVSNEVDYRKTANGEGASEELIIKLEDGKISYGAKINFAYMYGGELEVGIAEFYRDGVLVSTQTFSSNASSGNYAANFEVLDGGFDTIIIKATDNGNSFNVKDNSDFAVTGVEFLGTTAPQASSYGEGTISYGYGADGAGSLGFTNVKDNLTLTDGTTVTVTTTATSIIAKDSNGELVFQVQLTPSTGKWEFYQYKDFLIGDGTKETLDISFKVVDADGDGVDGSITIGVNKLPTSSDDSIEILEDNNHTLTLNDFGNNSNDFTKVKIETLPTNGILLLAGVAIIAGQEISKSDIESGKLVFKPTENSDADSGFSFKITNGTLWSASYNTDINIAAVADKPTASISVTKITSSDDGSSGSSNQTNTDFNDLDLLTASTQGSRKYENLDQDLVYSGTNDIVKDYQNANATNITTDKGNDTLEFQSANNKNINTGAGDDKVIINQGSSGNNVQLGEGNNSLTIGGSLNQGTTQAGAGNDTLIVNQGASGTQVNLGDGNNTISIKESLNSSNISTGNGNDTLIIGNNSDGNTIYTGGGADKVQINGNVQDTKIDLSDGNDSIKLSSQSNVNFNINTVIDGGKGDDTLYFSGKMEDYKVAVGVDTGNSALISWAQFVEMNKNADGYANKEFTIYEVDGNGTLQGSKFVVKNIENVVFESSENSGTVTTNDYKVDISAALADLDGSETLTVTINNVPTGATLTSTAYTLVDNGNNTWSVTIPAGTKSISDSITMSVPKSNTETVNLEITARATESNDNTNGLNFAEATANDGVPATTDDKITTNEDTSKVLTLSDFGTYSNGNGDAISSIKINTLPTNGVLMFNGAAISAGVVLNASDINSGKLVFIPNNNTDLDSSFTFQVSDSKDWSMTHTTSIEVIAVADKPTANINVERSVTIDTSNVTDTSKGYTVTAYNTSGNQTTISTVDGTNHNGFGVSGASSGDTTEIGYNNTTKSSEVLKVAFENDVSSVDVTFAYKNPNETAVVKFYKDGVLVGTQILTGGTDTVDGPFTLTADNGAAFDEVSFSALGKDDDYLINKISFTEVETNSSGAIVGDIYNVDISAALADTDGSESLTVTITNVPTGATLSSDSYTLVDNGNHTWSVTIPAGTSSIADSITMSVPTSNTDEINLGITARATETNDNADGLNYAETIDTDALVYGMNETNTLVFGEVTTNLLLTLDVSGSMSFKIDNSYETRLDIAKKSLIDTIKAYQANGETQVNLTLFKVDSKNVGWMSADEAIKYINSLQIDSKTYQLTSNGVNINLTDGTGYNDALIETMKVDFTGHDATQTIAYFISDGEANSAVDKIDQDSDTTIKNWKNYVDNNIDTLNVIGISKDISAKYLKIIQVQDGDNVILVQKEETLGDVLSGTVHSSITGDVLDNIIGGDGNTKIDSIVIDGKEYTKDNFPTDGVALDGDGKLTFNFDTGKYEYSVKSSEFSADTTKTFEVNASDEDGDKTTFDVNLKIDISPNESAHTLNISGEDIDLSAIISSNTNTDVINLENSKVDKISVDLNDVLLQEDHQLIIKGDLGDKVDLDTPSDWSNIGKEQLDGVNYNVYTGTGANSTVKLLIDDDIDVTPDI
ncbi:hypothetical protein CKA56_09250 [Arcobacter venerupis]|uniref:Calx-beta domain-containing protein n=1 Tax=Arcobacter venerupis TaxID=1054033 RepID=UPI000FEC0839|nr:Calx-beta domain-containing protein [Arcobacter venerupis]RWS49241.1 hypothetical protein CKA56_09250 [Arcobacter venerupis]